MRKMLIALTAAAPLAVLGWTANAYPISTPSLSQNYLLKPIGCEGGPSPKDRCPYGYRLRDGGCEPCGERHGSRYRDWNDRYAEPRRYRDYDEDYAPRRYSREY